MIRCGGGGGVGPKAAGVTPVEWALIGGCLRWKQLSAVAEGWREMQWIGLAYDFQDNRHANSVMALVNYRFLQQFACECLCNSFLIGL